MKKFICMILLCTFALGFAGCQLKPDVPANAIYEYDIQEYISDVLDQTAEITKAEKYSSNVDGNTLTVVYDVTYSGDQGENNARFTMIYVLEKRDWKLERCRVSLGDNSNQEETPSEPEETKGSVSQDNANKPDSISDDWKDFTFELDGELYQLPTHYDSFKNNGWKIDDDYSDELIDGEKLPAKSRLYTTLSNGAVDFSVEFINMSGNARKITDCDIGTVTVKANDNLNLKIASGIGCMSKLEDIQNAFGTPSSTSTYSDYSYFKYEADTYVGMTFYVYNENTKYNEITLRNCVARDRDETVAKEERPAYLDTYVAPTELGTDVEKTVFELDGVVYQLPCPLDAFLDNGWTIRSDSIGTLGAWNDEYGVSLEKGNFRFDVTMINLSDYETYTKNCAVSAVSFSGYNMKNLPDDIVKLPGGVTLRSTAADVEKLYEDLDFYESSLAKSYTYEDKNYTCKVKFTYYEDDAYAYIDVKNENWEYGA